MPRQVLLHAHLFKNAGSTLDWSLQRSFGPAFCDHRDDASMRGNPDYLRRFLEENPAIVALSSHWLPLPPPEAEDLLCKPLILLRDPLERMASVYAFERRQNVDHPGTRQAKSLSFRDYVRWRLEPRVGPVLRNYQARMLSGVYPGPDDAAQREAALANIRGCSAVGLVEDYDRSMVLMEAAYRPLFPSLDLAYVPQNVTDRSDQRSFDERRASVAAQLGDVFAAAQASNEGDLALYGQCAREFAQRWAELDDADARLADFRDRCRHLRVAGAGT